MAKPQLGQDHIRKKSTGALARLLDWALLSHLRAIDAQHIDPSRTSDGRILVVVYTSCVVLYLLNYVVLEAGYQREIAAFLIEKLGLFGAAGEQEADPSLTSLAMRAAWSLGCIFFYLLLPALACKLVLKRPLASMGLSPRGFFKHLWIYAVLFLPVAACVWVVSFQEPFQKTYPFYRNPSSLATLAVWELFYGLQFFSLEVFFRGFMLSELKHRWGWRAVLVMVTPYCMIHFSKPALEALGAIVAGTVLGFLALRTRTIWGGVAIHVAVAWWMDVASLIRRGWFQE